MYLGVSGRGGQARLCWMFVMTCLVFTFLCVIEPAHAAGASQTREVPPDPAPILFPRARGASSELQPTQLTPTSSEPQPQPQQPQHQTKEEEQPQHPPTQQQQQPQSLPSLPSELLPPKLPESTDTRVAGSISPERFDKLIQYPKIKPKEGPSGFYGRPPPLPRCDSIPFPLREKVHYEFSYAEHLGIDALHNDNAVNVKESVIQARDPFKDKVAQFGNNAEMLVPYSPLLEISQYTVTVWLRTDAKDIFTIAYTNGTTNSQCFDFVIDTEFNMVYGAIGSGSQWLAELDSNFTGDWNVWNHFAIGVRWDQATDLYYAETHINGVLRTQATFARNNTQNACLMRPPETITVGNSYEKDFYVGLMDDLSFFTCGLSTDEIHAVMNATAPHLEIVPPNDITDPCHCGFTQPPAVVEGGCVPLSPANYTDEHPPGDPDVILRVWHATDFCGQEAFKTQRIAISPPQLTLYEPRITVPVYSDLPLIVGDYQLKDTCSPTPPNVTVNDTWVFHDEHHTLTIVREYNVTDSCGNIRLEKQHIRIDPFLVFTNDVVPESLGTFSEGEENQVYSFLARILATGATRRLIRTAKLRQLAASGLLAPNGCGDNTADGVARSLFLKYRGVATHTVDTTHIKCPTVHSVHEIWANGTASHVDTILKSVSVAAQSAVYNQVGIAVQLNSVDRPFFANYCIILVGVLPGC